jgi:hypothetical protein
MSQKDRDRLKVLYEVEKGILTQKQAGVQLKLSERWARKLLARLRRAGDGGILHRLRGRALKRRLPEAVRRKVVKIVKREYADFGPTLAAEYLAERHGVEVSKEKLRQVLMAAFSWRLFLHSLLYGVDSFDLESVLLSVAVMLAAALLAAAIPARRATRVDPTVALRHE